MAENLFSLTGGNEDNRRNGMKRDGYNAEKDKDQNSAAKWSGHGVDKQNRVRCPAVSQYLVQVNAVPVRDNNSHINGGKQ